MLCLKSILYMRADFLVPERIHVLETLSGVEIKVSPEVLHHRGEIDAHEIYSHGLERLLRIDARIKVQARSS